MVIKYYSNKQYYIGTFKTMDVGFGGNDFYKKKQCYRNQYFQLDSRKKGA